MKALIVTVYLIAASAQQKPSPIRPDGIVARKEEHLIDLSSCDTVHISGPVHELTIRDGTFDAYWFKRYKTSQAMKFTCEIEVRR